MFRKIYPDIVRSIRLKDGLLKFMTYLTNLVYDEFVYKKRKTSKTTAVGNKLLPTNKQLLQFEDSIFPIQRPTFNIIELVNACNLFYNSMLLDGVKSAWRFYGFL